MLFDTYLEHDIKKPWEIEREEAKKAVEAQLSELQKFVRSNLTASMLSPLVFEKFLELRGIEGISVSYVQTPMPSWALTRRPRADRVA